MRRRPTRAGAFTALGVAMALAGFHAAPCAAAGERSIYALLGTGAVIRASLAGHGAVVIGDVSRAPIRDVGSGPFVARAGDALVLAVPGNPSRLFRMGLPGGPLNEIKALRRGLSVRALVVGPVTRHLYVVANEHNRDGTGALVVQALSADGQQILAERVVKPATAMVFSAAIAPDEQRLAIAYHGGAQGFDLVDPSTLTLACASPTTGGCFTGHGSVHFAGSRLFTATGGPAFAELLPSGSARTRDSGLAGNHLIEFADSGPDGRFLYITGACGYAGGLSRVDLRTGRIDVLARRGPVCGSRVLVAGDRLVLAANRLPVPPPTAASRIRVVDRRTGRVRRSIRTSGSIVDLALAG